MRALIHTTILTMLLTAYGPAQISAPDAQTIVSHMRTAMAGRNHDLAYSVTREYKLVPEDASKASRVVAEVNALPSGKKDYVITEGSGQAEGVVRKVLDHETDGNGQADRSAISPDNYNFAYLGTEPVDGHSCYVLQLTPKHDTKDVIKGRVWIDAESYLVRQLAGSPAKSPSWWIKDVQVTMHYRDVEGVWIQDMSQAVAQVRIVGKHTLTARALGVRTDTAVASRVKLPSKRGHRADPSMLGAGVFARR